MYVCPCFTVAVQYLKYMFCCAMSLDIKSCQDFLFLHQTNTYQQPCATAFFDKPFPATDERLANKAN